MAFSDASIKILRENPELRREFVQKLSQLSTKTEKPTKAAKKAVQSIEQQETRILGSDAYRQAFNETVKPEMKPLQPTSDLYEKGYMQEEAFWNDRHNRVAYSYGQNARMKGLLRSLCDGDGTRALIESRRAEARALSEVAPKEEFKINVPMPKAKKKAAPQPANTELNKTSTSQEKSYKESVDNVTKEYIGSSRDLKTYIEPEQNAANKLNSQYDKELVKTDKATKEVFYKESCQ